MRRLPIVILPLLLLVACGGGDGDDDEATAGGDPTDETAGGSAGTGTIAVRLEPTEGIFVEGFEVGLRFTAPERGEEIERVLWSEFVAGLGSTEMNAYYDSVLEQPVPAGVVRIGADVSIGIGPGPEPPDLDAASLPCELEVEVADGETVTVEVAFDDAAEDCLRVVD